MSRPSGIRFGGDRRAEQFSRRPAWARQTSILDAIRVASVATRSLPAHAWRTACINGYLRRSIINAVFTMQQRNCIQFALKGTWLLWMVGLRLAVARE
jgi:hypothetical protein